MQAAHPNVVTIIGEGFTEASKCKQTDMEDDAPTTFVSNTLLMCALPALHAGTVHLEVVSGGYLDTSSHALALDVVQPIQVLGIEPSIAPELTAVSVTVYGSNFFGTDLFCRLGVQKATQAMVLSTTMIQCQLPPKPASNVTVSLVGDGVSTSFGGLPMILTPRARVVEIIPSSGPARGGSTVTFVGTGFRSGAVSFCNIGSASQWLTVVSDEQATCITQPGSTGMTRIGLAYSDGSFVGAHFEYAYVPEPKIASLRPSSGVAFGGTLSFDAFYVE